MRSASKAGRLRPTFLGMGNSGGVRLLARSSRGFELPLSSLSGRGSRPAVWVVGREAGRPTLTPVSVREYRQESVVIADGLKPGDLVVTAGVQKIDPEVAVRPWEDRR